MRKRYNITFLIVILIAVFIILIPISYNNLSLPTVVFSEVEVPVEVASTQAERQKGLMFRSSLEGGMLFIFEGEQNLGFWMKNTLIPLDMIFINSGFEIVKIHTAVPCEEDPCPIYNSEAPALYVVEVNAGFAKENGIDIGDSVEIKDVF
jgi:uncharacterized membrane protein (UPF0127 family)